MEPTSHTLEGRFVFLFLRSPLSLKYLFFTLCLAVLGSGSPLLQGLFSSCGERGLFFTAECGLLTVVSSLVVEQAWALEHKLNCCGARA